MEPITHAIYRQAQWVQPKISQNRFELRAGEDVFAELVFPKMFGSLGEANSVDGRWTFKRVGFFNPQVTVRKAGEEFDLAVFRPNWTGSEGHIQFTGGSSFTWKAANFWATQYSILDSSGNSLIQFRQGIEDSNFSDLFKVQASIEIQPSAQGLKELSLLVLLGWYVIILKHHDDAAAAAA